MNAVDPHLAIAVLRQFRLIFSAVRTHFARIERASGVAGAQIWALGIINERPGLGVSELAEAMDVHQSTASNLVRGLVARDLVRSDRSGADRRVASLTIRPAGRAVLRRLPGPFSGVLPAALQSLDAPTLRRLEKELGVLVRVLGPDAKAARKPLSQM